MLTVKGQLNDPEKGVEYLHRGIAQRSFEHRFQLADHVKVVGANLRNGLLDVELAREVPEAMKPRKIEIGSGVSAAARDRGHGQPPRRPDPECRAGRPGSGAVGPDMVEEGARAPSFACCASRRRLFSGAAPGYIPPIMSSSMPRAARRGHRLPEVA